MKAKWIMRVFYVIIFAYVGYIYYGAAKCKLDGHHPIPSIGHFECLP